MTDDRLMELRRARLSERILGSAPVLDGVPAKDVLDGIRRVLWETYNEDLLETPPEKIYEFVPKPTRNGDKVRITGGLVGGDKPFARGPERALIKRSDGAWLHFTLTLRCGKKSKKDKVEELWAYNFELVFPECPEPHSPSFVRFDLNEPGHTNEDREIRSHMHPANDDLHLPAPVMTPEELLDVLIRQFRNMRDPERPRS